MIASRFHSDLCTTGPDGLPCQVQSCKILQALVHMEQNIRSDERKYIIPKICKRCEMGQELVLDATGRYAHRAHVGAYLHDCHAAAIHDMLVTPAVQVEEK